MLDKIDVKYFKLAVGLDSIGNESNFDISARCPICGDSKKNKSTKRLHLYKKGEVVNVNCFNGNCSCQNKTVYSFLKDYYPELLPQYKREQFGNTLTKLSNGGEDVFASFKQEEKQDILTHDLAPYLKPIEDVPEALEYIKRRGFNYNELKEYYGKWYFGYQDLKIGEKLYKITNAIVIPLYYKNQMYGFYSRNIYDKTFFTYMHDVNIGFKIWNWFNIDKSSPCYIFEGIFDALSSGLPNIIALMGAKLPEERLKELSRPIFVLDNDKTGLLNSLRYSKQAKVYVQPNTLIEKDMNELMLNHPDLRISQMINNNLYQGISAEIKIKAKL